MNKLVSIIIPTFNRKKEILATLSDLSRQSYPDFEVIIIDKSDIPLKKEEINSLGLNVHVFYKSGEGSHLARNLGIEKAKGDIIIFVDDDVHIENKDFIKNHLENYKDSQISGVAGREIQPHNTFKPEEVKVVGKINFVTGRVIGDFNALFRTEVDHAVGCNMSFRKSVLKEVGGFDSSYQGTAYFEEADLSLKIKERGYKIVFDPKTTLVHLQAKRGGNRAKNFYFWRYWYFHNYVILFFRHMNPVFRSLFLMSQGIWIIGSSLKRLDFQNAKVCFQGMVKGYKDWRESVKK